MTELLTELITEFHQASNRLQLAATGLDNTPHAAYLANVKDRLTEINGLFVRISRIWPQNTDAA